jgi:hypothetical protein
MPNWSGIAILKYSSGLTYGIDAVQVHLIAVLNVKVTGADNSSLLGNSLKPRSRSIRSLTNLNEQRGDATWAESAEIIQ